MLNFDEFKAANAREKSQVRMEEELKSASKPRKSSKPSTIPPEKMSPLKESRSTLGEFLEMPQLQAFVVVMIILDSYVSFAELFVQQIQFSESNTNFIRLLANYQHIVHPIMRSFTGFALSFFCVEMLSIMLVFRLSIVGHFGYVCDIFIITFQLYLELSGFGKETRLLNIFRLWRLARLFNSLVNIEKDLHAQSKAHIAALDDDLLETQRQISGLKGDLIKEKEAKDAVESMLQGFKDEVDTLNEALKIAAMDIAEVAQADDDLLLTDDDEEDEDGSSRADVYVDAASSEFDDTKGRAMVQLEARRASSMSTAGVELNTPTTIFVNEDGSFIKK